MKDILIFGAGGNCVDILDAITEINQLQASPRYRVLGFLDDNASLLDRDYHGSRVLGSLVSARDYAECLFVNGIGSPSNFWKKQRVIESVGVESDRFETIIHPQASVSRWASIGRGSVVLQNAIVTAGAKVGNHVMILPGSVISHDVTVGDYCSIASGSCIAGGATLGESCYLGANSSVGNNLQIGRFSLVGMGAVVLKDLPAKAVAVGNPARIIRETF